MRKEGIVEHFKKLSQHLSGQTEENHVQPISQN